MIEFSNRARRDLRRVGPSADRQRIVDGLRALEAGAENLDIREIEGQSPWRRLRVGDYRVLYRPIDGGWWVERIINRRDLDKALGTL